MVEISVIIPTYNEEKVIGKTLGYLSRQTLPRSYYELIVVDGGSSDRTVEVASRLADRVIYQSGKGVGGARNDGAKVARGRILVHTDADIAPSQDWLERILSGFSEGVVAVCGPDAPIEKKFRYLLLYFFINLFSDVTYRMGVVGTRGTNTAVLRDKFFEVGGYTDYPLCDDVELGFRLRRLGKVVYTRKTLVKASARRLEKYGILRVLSGWIRGDLMLIRGRRTVGSYHRESY
ncbi:MAG: glycosyltransferase [Candidatus Verstraetearchaeota archaeon]|nr:glycosyltransferase [Candidatus Verstraetearchaeota archaeon]